jgi:MYXO-CTERM domain-containing protein
MMHRSSFGIAVTALAFASLPARAAPPKQTWTWEQKHPAHSPAFANVHAMTYDETRRRVVLFAGRRGEVAAVGTWEWDGNDWIDRTPAPTAKSPSARAGVSLAYDSARKKVLLFGGNGPAGTNWADLSDTWEWDGTVWVEKKPSAHPSPRSDAPMAFDAAHGEVLLHGGLAADANGALPLGDTWTWNGSNWTKRTPASAPGPRNGFGLAYHPRRKQILLYGGGAETGGLFDTWEWNTSNWFERAPAHNPGIKDRYALAGAGGRQRLLLFGGTPGYSNEVWEWTGLDWERPTISGSSPPGRASPAMVYDAARGEYVMFGGYDGSKTFSDTWVFRSRGGACGDVTDCDAVACVDGVCCDRACDGSCEACNVEGKVGTCSPVAGAPVGGRSCVGGGAGPCRATCDGTKTTCAYPTSATSCGATTCVDGIRTSMACDGAGSCKTSTSSCPIADAGIEGGAEDAGDPDAGDPDAGDTAILDASSEPDASAPKVSEPNGASTRDASAPSNDDAGTSDSFDAEDAGCGCHSASDPAGGAAGSLVLALGVLALRRPRRRADTSVDRIRRQSSFGRSRDVASRIRPS